jgi:c-di-GMP-binding flagellar brake protein YcgR
MDPEDKAYFLALNLEGKEYRFGLLNTSLGGMGMLVKGQETDILEKIKIGDQREMEYSTPENTQFMNLMIRHVTPIEAGTHRGHYQVGLALS